MNDPVKKTLNVVNNLGTAMIADTLHTRRLQQALEEFLLILSPDEISKLTATTPGSQSIVNLTLEVDGKGKKRQLRLCADYFEPFLDSIQRYSQAENVMISSDAQIAAVVWGSVEVVIIAALNFPTFFQKLAEMFRTIGYVCPVKKGFQEIFTESAEFRKSLSEFYAVVIEFCTEAMRFLKKNSVQQSTGLLGHFDFQKFENQLRKQRKTIILNQSLAADGAAHNARLQMSLFPQRGEQDWDDEILQWVSNDERELSTVANEKDLERVREALLERLSNYNYKSSFSEACKQRYQGTGQWLFDCPEFGAWNEADASCGLWVHGIPGSGKTVIAAAVVEHLFPLSRSSNTSTRKSISYFFCNSNDRRSREPQTILTTLARQILNIFDETKEIAKSLSSMFVVNHREPNIEEISVLFASVARLPTASYIIIDGLDECNDRDRREILAFFGVLMRQIPCGIKILICSRWMDSELLENFHQISIHSSRNRSDISLYIHEILDEKINDRSIVIKDPGMADEIKQCLIRKSGGMFLWVTFQIFELSRENTDAGIRTALESLPTGLHETYARILERIQKERKPYVARGIFQWLAVARRPLSFAEIAESTALAPGCLTWNEDYLPTNPFRLIEDCGNLVTQRIDDNTIQFAHSTVLEFLLSSPLSTPTPELFITELEANLYVAQVCLAYLSFPEFRSQISTMPEDRTVAATDMSGTELVPSIVRGNRAGEFMRNIARYCRMPIQSPNVTAATSLPLPSPEPSPADMLIRKHMLLDYVATNWIYHCARLPQGDLSHWRTFEALVFDRILPFTHLPWTPAGEQLTRQGSVGGRDSVDYEVLLTWAAENHHISLFNLVINTMRINGRTDNEIPIQQAWGVACRTGDAELVALMLSMDANVVVGLKSQMLGELDGPDHQSPMQAAAAGGHLAVVECLLSAEVDVNAPAGNDGRTALQAAAAGGHLAVVECLLLANADVNAQLAEYPARTALQEAAAGGHLAVVECLLSAEADVNAPHEMGNRTALQAAAAGGHLAVVERLLLAKPDINASLGDGSRTALHAAAAGGYLAVVECLVSAEADVNSSAGNNGQTALQGAAGGGHLAVVQCLLLAKADANAPSCHFVGRTALQGAAEGGHLAVVECLLLAKADPNAPPSRLSGRRALRAAAAGGHLAVVECLLSAGANVNEPAVNNARTALQAAAEGGHLAVVERLLLANADVNALPAVYSGRTALQAAAEGGHLEVVECLLLAKADVNAPPCKSSGRTALQAAARYGHLEVVDCLLLANADANAPPSESTGRTALKAAAEGGNVSVVERLLLAKADVNAALGDCCRTALQAAAEGGHLAVVECLLRANADVNAQPAVYPGRTALQEAAEEGHLEVLECLLSAGAEIHVPPVKHCLRTVLQGAAYGGHLALVERLLAAKADVHAIDGYGRRTALESAANRGHLAVVERLLLANADVDARACETFGDTALQAAAPGGHLEVAKCLLSAGANVNAPASQYGQTALQDAAGFGMFAMVKFLLSAGADVNAPTGEYGRTALAGAARFGHLAMVECLLLAKADVNLALGNTGLRQSALHAAAEQGHLAVVECLLLANADVNVRVSENGFPTVLQVAAGNGHLEVVERLLLAKADVNAPAGNNGLGKTALQEAAGGRHLEVVKCLLLANADVNAAPAKPNGRTALEAALEGHAWAVVDILRAAGAKD